MALNAGKTIITHTDAVSVPGWSGAGYIIFDQETGDGAYKISGGHNGAFLLFLGALLLVLGLFFWGAAIGILLFTYGAIMMFVGFLLLMFSDVPFSLTVLGLVRGLLTIAGLMMVVITSDAILVGVMATLRILANVNANSGDREHPT